jgi:hypothetical protein
MTQPDTSLSPLMSQAIHERLEPASKLDFRFKFVATIVGIRPPMGHK